MTEPLPDPAQASPASLESVFRKYNDFVFRICMRHMRDEREAEDLAQEVFLKLHKRLADFRGDSRLTTWIYRIASNCCIDALRARKSQAPLDDADLDGQVALNICGHESASLARIDLDRILGQTDARTREILFLSLAEGCTNQEVAEVVGMTRWAVAKVVLRFQKRMRTQRTRLFGGLFQKEAA